MKPIRQCSVPDCIVKPGHSVVRGYCPKHLYRFERYGDPLVTRVAVGRPEEKLEHYGWTETAEGCWVWNGPRNKKGYGRLGDLEVHRVAYETWVGTIPAGLQVRHRCDNRPCIRPAHLLVGTIADNMRDKVERNRQARGSRNGFARLSESDVLSIRQSYAVGGVTYKALAEQYGVSGTMVGYIVTRHYWKHVLDKEVEDIESAES